MAIDNKDTRREKLKKKIMKRDGFKEIKDTDVDIDWDLKDGIFKKKMSEIIRETDKFCEEVKKNILIANKEEKRKKRARKYLLDKIPSIGKFKYNEANRKEIGHGDE